MLLKNPTHSIDSSRHRKSTPVITGGTRSAIVIFARFKDETRVDSEIPAWAAGIFDPDRPGSFSHFYDNMSLGRLRVRGKVASRWYEAADVAAAYVASDHTEPGGFGRFALEVIQQADADIDFSQFDNDGPDGLANSGDDDGAVDAVFVVVPSTLANFLLGPATGIATLGLDSDYVTDDPGVGSSIRITKSHGSIQQGKTFAEAVGASSHIAPTRGCRAESIPPSDPRG